MSAWPKGKKHSPETRERMRAARLKLNADPEFAARNATAVQAVFARRCAFCLAKYSLRYPVMPTLDEDGEVFLACSNIDRCRALVKHEPPRRKKSAA